MEGSALRRLIEFEIVQEVVDDLLIFEAHLGKLAATDFHDLVDVTLAPGVLIVHAAVVRIVGLWVRDGLNAAKRGVVAMHG